MRFSGMLAVICSTVRNSDTLKQCSTQKVINEHNPARPRKIKGLFALLAWKSGGSVGRSLSRSLFFFFFFFLNLDTWEMQYYSCVCLLGHAQPRIGQLIVVVVGGCIPLYLVKVPFGESYYIFWHFNLTFLFKNAKLRIKKRRKKMLTLISDILDRSEKDKQTSFFFRPKHFFYLVCIIRTHTVYQGGWRFQVYFKYEVESL